MSKHFTSIFSEDQHPLVVRVVQNGLDDLDHVTFEDFFQDDHDLCLDSTFHFKDGTSYEVCLWWVSPQLIYKLGAACAGSMLGKADIEEYIMSYMDNDVTHDPDYYMKGYKTP